MHKFMFISTNETRKYSIFHWVVSPITRAYVVLGIQWLKILGPLSLIMLLYLCDFDEWILPSICKVFLTIRLAEYHLVNLKGCNIPILSVYFHLALSTSTDSTSQMDVPAEVHSICFKIMTCFRNHKAFPQSVRPHITYARLPVLT